MSDPAELAFELRSAAGEPRGALVLLHGRGTDERDLSPLLDELDPERRLLGVTPRGPLALAPGGRHWYVVERVGHPEARSFKETYATLEAWLDTTLPALTGVPLERTILGGFSQGAVMAYALALGRSRPSPAALLALSGFIPSVAGFELELEGRQLPVAIGHGSFDPIIPVQFARDARVRLSEAGLEVEFRESPMAHTVDPAFVAELRPWLRRATDGRGS